MRTHILLYREDITPHWVPTPQRFQDSGDPATGLNTVLNEEPTKR
ncbi:MAG: hypothetical protein R2932_59735 [Caldilineaceae bacterium]